MKTTLLTLAAFLMIGSAKAQYTQNFENGAGSLSGACWSLTNVYTTSDPSEVITGNASLYTNPPTNGSGNRELVTPALEVTSTNFVVSFNYKLNNALNGNATRTIEVGLLDASNAYSTLTVITMDRNTPSGVQNFNTAFTLASTGCRKLVLKFGGSNGDGNCRIILDDLYVNASAKYVQGCNSAPIAVDDVFNALLGAAVIGNVMNNDNEPNGENMTASTVTLSPNGLLVMNANGSFVFTPFLLFTGPTTSFTYNLKDDGISPMTSNTATVTVNYGSASTLPVTLVSFNAVLGNNNRVNLTWTTETEINVSHFVVERSVDGTNFSDAAVVFATGNSNVKINYAYADQLTNVNDKVIYYRLRSVDIDSKTQYSETRVIRLAKNSGSGVSILTYPNPVVSDLRVTIPSNWQSKKVVYEMYSINGSLVSKKENANSSQTETINVSNLKAGVYMVRVSCEGETAVQKIVKQ